MPYRNFPRRQWGQSMTEYTVVLVFGVLALTTGPSGDVMQELVQVIKQNYSGYSYAISLSEPPDYDNAEAYAIALDGHGLDDPEIDRLAVETPELLSGLKTYNKDPNTQLKKVTDIKDTLLEEIPTSPGDILDGAGSFF